VTPGFIQRTLESAWRKALQVDEVSLDDNFFELGGTSLDAVDVIDQLNIELGTDISEIGLFERPTIRAMAELLRSVTDSVTEPDKPGQGILDSMSRGARRRDARA
jgi:acyl carrier protein